MTKGEAYDAYRALGELNPSALTPAFIRDMTAARQALQGPAMRVQEEIRTHAEAVMDEDQEQPTPEQISEIEEAVRPTRQEEASVEAPTIDPRSLESSAAVMKVLGIEALEPIFPEAMVASE
jgi:hypothetical protein